MNDSRTPKLDYIILCDSVSSSPEGKKTLYGLFDTINSKVFPCVHSNFFIVIRFMNGMGTHEVVVQIVDPKDNIIFKAPQTLEIKLDSPLSSVDLLMQFQVFEFRSPGHYKIKIVLDGRVMEETRTFELKQV